MATGCGSAVTDANVNSNANANVTVVNANPPANSNIVPYVPPGSEGINANAFNANAAAAQPAPTPNAKYMTYPAPDNSEYSTVMDKNGMPVETRVFRSDPQIRKIVRTWLSVNDKKIAVHLKNGRVIDLPGNKFDEIKSVPVAEIYSAVGLKMPAPPAATRPGKTDGKTSSQ
jgi:hypothetical protein